MTLPKWVYSPQAFPGSGSSRRFAHIETPRPAHYALLLKKWSGSRDDVVHRQTSVSWQPSSSFPGIWTDSLAGEQALRKLIEGRIAARNTAECSVLSVLRKNGNGRCNNQTSAASIDVCWTFRPHRSDQSKPTISFSRNFRGLAYSELPSWFASPSSPNRGICSRLLATKHL